MRLGDSYTDLLAQFDPVSEQIIATDSFIDKSNKVDFPKIAVLSFTQSIIEKYASLKGVEVIDHILSSTGTRPIYSIEYQGNKIAFTLAYIGAPALVAEVEELIARGAEKIVVFGSCGALDGKLVDGHIVIPAEAMRDEGTSYHYAPASDSIFMDEHSVSVLKEVMEEFGYPYIVGKTWTTDAIYRETRDKAELRRKQGCCVVEMECSALIAAAAFRGIKFAQFIYAADNLDADSWEQRGLTMDQGLSQSDVYMQAAFECGIRL